MIRSYHGSRFAKLPGREIMYRFEYSGPTPRTFAGKTLVDAYSKARDATGEIPQRVKFDYYRVAEDVYRELI